jgi:colicin import membrane protein
LSTIPRTTDSRSGPPPDDPYYYGFRERLERGPDGKKRLVSVPLTEEDVLHPLEGDHITKNTPHQTDCQYLSDVVDSQLVGVTGAVRLTDCRVDLGLPGVRPVGPDVVVCVDVASDGPWSTFSVADEGATIALVVEITSPATRNNDLNVKPDWYWRAGVQRYVIVDQVSMRSGVRQLRILAFERGTRRWRRMRLRRGRVWLDVVQIWLGVENGQIVCWDADGREILPYSELGEAHAAAELALEEERRLRAEAQAAAEQALEEARRLRADAEKRIRQLEEENRRLRGES